MCALRDAAPTFQKKGITVFGISLDDVKSQAKFHKDQKLGFHLLSDPDGSAAKKYGVLMKGMPYARRVTFVIDDEGIVRDIITRVDLAQHGEQVLKLVAKSKG